MRSPGVRDAHSARSAIGRVAGAVAPVEQSVDDRVGRLHPHVPDAHASLRQLRAGRREEPLHRARIARGDLQRPLGGELAQARVAARRHLAQIGHRVELDVGFGEAVQHGRLDLGRHDLRVRAVAVEDSARPSCSWRRHPVRRLRPAGPEMLAVLDRRRDDAHLARHLFEPGKRRSPSTAPDRLRPAG